MEALVRHCAICHIPVCYLVPIPGQFTYSFEPLDTWGVTRDSLAGYRCKEHVGVERAHIAAHAEVK